ncbi:MAG: SpoIIE family protein phosphatase [Bacteroidetes bacterium]|nr:SpoIIE family protein phosphatase [Bacteroidota bacterium]
MKKALLILMSVVFISAPEISSQINNFKSYSIEDGLPVSTVLTMIQDSRGYLWLGTQGGGVSRFDGYNFINFNSEKGLANNTIRTILEDSKGNLWFGTDDGISFYDGYSFRTINKDDGLSGTLVVKIYEDKQNNIWAGTDEGLNKIGFVNNYDSVNIKTYSYIDGLSDNLIFDIYEDRYERLWLAFYGGGINILTFSDNAGLQVDKLFRGTIPSDIILCIEEDSEGNLWFGTGDEGAFKIEGFTSSSLGKIKTFNINNGFPDNTIWDILSDNDGNIWFGTDKAGIVKYDQDQFRNYSIEQGFPDKQVLCLLQDSEKNIWTGTFSSGICRLMGEHFSHYTEEQGLTNNQIYDIDQDAKANYWLASHGGGLIKLTFQNDKPFFKSYTVDDGLPDNYINSIYITEDNIIWLATKENGIARFDGKNIINYTEENHLVDNHVNCIMVDSRQQVWSGTRGGISLLNDKGFFTINEENWELPHNEVQTIIEDKNGNIWVGTLAGLAKIKDSTMTTFDEEEGLYFKEIYALAEDTDGNIWIGTNGGGLFKYEIDSQEEQPIKLIADNSILRSTNIVSLVFQNDSVLLVGTNVGFDKLVLDKKGEIISAKNYYKSNGFIGMENNLNSILKDNKGNIWFGTVKGITCYKPELEKINTKPPINHLTELDLLFKKVNWNEHADSLYPWTLLPRSLRLPYSENHLTFKWTGISLSNPENVRYKYKLDPVDKDWSPSRLLPEQTYSGISPGDYSFLVMSENENGIWNKKPFTFNFTIRPPFYQTWWFITIMVVMVIIAIITYIKYREKQLVREKRILEQKVNERTVEILKQKTEIENQKDIIEQKNIDITDSIRYAKRIQDAILPSLKVIKDNLKDSFVLYLPKDIVSGDFYWVKEKNESLVIVAADCTGHGVPGAFMSMLGISFLNEIVEKDNITSPEKILNTLRENIVTALRQRGLETESKDGMDMAVCAYNKKLKRLSFAGANNPLYLVRNRELVQTDGNRMPVAIHIKMEDFTKHDIPIEPGDSLYIFSDGFVDQFGGPEGKKFKNKKFKQLLVDIQGENMGVQKEILNKTMTEWRGEQEQIDDIVVLGFKV